MSDNLLFGRLIVTFQHLLFCTKRPNVTNQKMPKPKRQDGNEHHDDDSGIHRTEDETPHQPIERASSASETTEDTEDHEVYSDTSDEDLQEIKHAANNFSLLQEMMKVQPLRMTPSSEEDSNRVNVDSSGSVSPSSTVNLTLSVQSEDGTLISPRKRGGGILQNQIATLMPETAMLFQVDRNLLEKKMNLTKELIHSEEAFVNGLDILKEVS